MKTSLITNPKPRTTLWWIGFWATVWWAVSCLYVLLLFWVARDRYASIPLTSTRGFWNAWGTAITGEYHASKYLQVLVITIIAVWAIGAYIWLLELKRDHLSYKAAFKDLFLTVRK